jgi:putative Ca2+/H+ antiporter (TMEM165/GDT1 family)
MTSLLLTTYTAVLLAEMLGDKLAYTAGVLATRYRLTPILTGMAAAFAVKMGAAVWLGSIIASLPPVVVAAASVAGFAGVVLALWWRPPAAEELPSTQPAAKIGGLTFTAVVLSEWGDPGQVAAAAMAAKFDAPVAVWLAAVAAMMTKSAVLASLGATARDGLARRFSPETLRLARVAAMVVLGAFTAFEAL